MSGVLRSAWLKWRSLKLPWRRRFLIGTDLAGNTFWEFKDAHSSRRYRRIVEFGRKTHYSDVKITPQWHQWLRHTREHPPTINEQQLDEIRQARMKQLAQAADERWKQQPSYLDPPKEQPSPGFKLRDHGANYPQQSGEAEEGVMNHVASHGEVKEVSRGTDGRQVDKGRFKGETRQRGPWEVEAGKNPGQQSGGEAWQPRTAIRRS